MTFLCFECGKNLDENLFYRKVKNKCKDCLNKKLKCQVCGKFFTKKWLATHIDREHHQNESNSNALEKPKIDNVITNNNNPTLLVGPSFSGKTYLLLKILSRMSKRDIYIITKSPPEQFSNSKIKIKEIGEDIKPLNEYENAIIVFDDILGTSNLTAKIATAAASRNSKQALSTLPELITFYNTGKGLYLGNFV